MVTPSTWYWTSLPRPPRTWPSTTPAWRLTMSWISCTGSCWISCRCRVARVLASATTGTLRPTRRSLTNRLPPPALPARPGRRADRADRRRPGPSPPRSSQEHGLPGQLRQDGAGLWIGDPQAIEVDAGAQPLAPQDRVVLARPL